ncbi:MAG: fatty acyl-AMP ligase [Deltaproteobacteria bacterium]|nr:fatty acyl-AMP ligase [Deltaproteobacteria bacterium]
METDRTPPLRPLTRAPTLGELLLEGAEPERNVSLRFLFVGDDGPPGRRGDAPDDGVTLRGLEVLEVARRAAAHLRARGVSAGDRVLVLLGGGPAFLAAFGGCQLLGAVPVSLSPPLPTGSVDEHLARIGRVAALSGAVATVTLPEVAAYLRLGRGRGPGGEPALSRIILGRDLLAEPTRLARPHQARPEDPAFVQCTSGATGDPRLVVLSHRALLTNVRTIATVLGFREGDGGCAWLPLFHDMGLMGFVLCPLAGGIPSVILPPEVFVRRPQEWLLGIARYRATISAAPNFGYALCARRVQPADLAAADLSCWRLALCGGEAVSPRTLAAFASRFAPMGFRESSFLPVYGLAEICLAATLPPLGRPPRIDSVEREAVLCRQVATPAGESLAPAETIGFVSVGRAMPAHEVRLVDAEGRPVAERRLGEIEVRGPSLMNGYWGAEAQTAAVLRDGWLRTGDLGYLADGELFVTGRHKDVIITRGRNLFPEDIERAVDGVPGVRVGRSVAFGVPDEELGTERIVVLCETRLGGQPERDRLQRQVRVAVLTATGMSPVEVVVAAPGTICKTTSGKLQRRRMRERYLLGQLGPPRETLLTRARLGASFFLERAKRAITRRRGARR